ncbi:2-amino-4-hydroxy-6-hydroxymethyldihydropteridine diphosphokinase [Evansella sp. AB-rgal1]|uniref:2-amino-4-hydroxy-6- hydroxymethyldihydropteridine diphosphokinase n=1 Tax=Evansella sp. AB-rgal1 TaxID=3242696 RepID=UPI00359E75FB
MTNIAYISLGSNIENRYTHLSEAIDRIEANERISVLKQSSIYETAPVGIVDQSPFLNIVLKITTSLTADDLLTFLQLVETTGGRTREVRWGPRTIDLDILLFNKENINLEHLVVPHPRMLERSFVLIPFLEIEPSYTFSNGKSIDEYITELTDKEGVQKWKRSSGVDASEHSES